jgi:hypothetical protein
MKLNLKNMLFAGALMLATTFLPRLAAAQERTFTVYNNSSYTIDNLYVSPTGDRNWENDRLGNRYFPPTYRFDLPLDPGYYDVKLVDQDGDTCVVNHVNFLDGGTWTITNAVLLACEVISSH